MLVIGLMGSNHIISRQSVLIVSNCSTRQKMNAVIYSANTPRNFFFNRLHVYGEKQLTSSQNSTNVNAKFEITIASLGKTFTRQTVCGNADVSNS